MPDRIRSAMMVAAVLFAAGCDSVTEPDTLEQFTWGEVAAGETVEDGIDVSQGLGDIFILGELNTPTRCYSLSGDLERSGARLTLHVEARTSQAPSCADAAGAYRYTAVLRNLEAGAYQLRVIHDISGGEAREFTASVDIS